MAVKKRGLTDKEVEMLEEVFPHHTTKELAKMFGTTEKSISYYARKKKWKKSSEEISNVRSISGTLGNQVRWNK